MKLLPPRRVRSITKKATLSVLLAFTLMGIADSACVAASPVVKERWITPVASEVSRQFDYGTDRFRSGQHRGVDFDVRPRTKVRSACSGRVVFVGRAFGVRDIVSVRCSAWRVSYLPLVHATVCSGQTVAAGSLIGEVGSDSDHRGLHFGVRSEADRLGYVDPLQFFADSRSRPLPPTLTLPRSAPAGFQLKPKLPPQALPARSPLHQRLPELTRRRSLELIKPSPKYAPSALPPPIVLPWPVWFGFGLFIVGLGGGVTISFRRARRPRAAELRTASVQR